MLAFAMILKFLVAPKCFGAEDTIFTEPLAGEVSIVIHGLVVGQLGFGCGRVRRHGKNCILIQARAAVVAVEVCIMMIQIICETMAEIMGKTKVLPDGRTNVKRNVAAWLLRTEDGIDYGLWLG